MAKMSDDDRTLMIDLKAVVKVGRLDAVGALALMGAGLAHRPTGAYPLVLTAAGNAMLASLTKKPDVEA